MMERTLQTTNNKENADITCDVTLQIWEAIPANILFTLSIRFV